jgi:beta-lactamase regulating signal transducer with metallopeptidase domain
MEMSTIFQVLARFAAESLASSIWQSFLLAVSVGICLRYTPKGSANHRFLLWTVVFLAAAFLPLLSLSHASGYSQSTVLSTSHPVLHLPAKWAFAILALWLAMSLYRGSTLLLNAWKLRTLWKRAVPIQDERLAFLNIAASGLRHAQICRSSDLDQPCVIGFFSPRILIPDWLLEKLTAVEAEQIVLHEIEHLRRFDDWFNLLQKFSLVLFPLNPVLLWIERRLCLERELACDESVVRSTSSATSYATCLTSLAEKKMAHRAAALTLAAWDKQSSLARRVHLILGIDKTVNPRTGRALLTTLAFGTFAAAIFLSSAPQLISFRAPEIYTAAPIVAENSVPSRSLYREAVFHPGQAVAHSQDLTAGVTVDARKVSFTKPARKATVRTADHRSKPAVQTLQGVLLVTRWSDGYSEGASYTLINFSPRPAHDRKPSPQVVDPGFAVYAPVSVPASWFEIQL